MKKKRVIKVTDKPASTTIRWQWTPGSTPEEFTSTDAKAIEQEYFHRYKQYAEGKLYSLEIRQEL